ncbi:MAG: methyltransferase domain-containing protein [bacterium]|nr:methyltransferase domain-containing protein [bacterium]
MNRQRRVSGAPGQPTEQGKPLVIEIEVAEGLESFAQDELKGLVRTNVAVSKGALTFTHTGQLAPLLSLHTANSVYLLLHFPVPRPRALLGHEHFHRILAHIRLVRDIDPAAEFRTFFISAAGADSSVMQRLKQEIATQTGLVHGDENGDLLIRIRRSGEGWDVLLRLSARPLATRPWRVCNYEGALNGPVASAMAMLLNASPDDVYVNLACGSGTLLIEQMSYQRVRWAAGIDRSTDALKCARQNIRATSLSHHVDLLQADVRQLPLASNSVDLLSADLPFGQLSGSHTENQRLYPALLHEAARIARPKARFILITHEVRLIETLLSTSNLWKIVTVQRVSLRGLHPRIYLLQSVKEA